MKTRLMMIAFTAACAEAPPFTYRIEHVAGDGTPTSIEFEEEFENFETAVAAGPFTVEVTERGQPGTLTLSPGYCRRYECAGPLVLEEVTVNLTTTSPDHITSFECTGLDGGVYGGIDTLFAGDCGDGPTPSVDGHASAAGLPEREFSRAR